MVCRANLDYGEEINSCHCQESISISHLVTIPTVLCLLSSIPSSCINVMKVLYDHLTNCTVLFLFIYHCLFTAVCGSISSVVLDQNTLLFFNLYNLLKIIKMCYYHITT